ncbi:tachykinin-like peptides receptor 86C [Paramormyrops kingsleyae]|uniref:tachykinin-like peptides receptor 86C n=1 Tax=Paramormyrops kingsleyae TaxID=1676925 RepID=UPI003B97B268
MTLYKLSAEVTVSSVALFITFFAGICANGFVIWALYRQKSLQTSNNALLANLAIIDLFRSIIDCPLLLRISLQFHADDDLGILLCYAQIVCFSFSCCMQLVILAGINVEGYQAITNPFKTRQRRKRIVFCIALSCGLGVYLERISSYNSFGIYILFPLWFGCLAVIISFYGRIFVIGRTHHRKIFNELNSLTEVKQKKDFLSFLPPSVRLMQPSREYMPGH